MSFRRSRIGFVQTFFNNLLDGKIDQLLPDSFKQGQIAVIDILRNRINAMFAFVRSRHIEWKINHILHPANSSALIKTLGIALNTNIQRCMDKKPNQTLSQNLRYDISLNVFGSHCSNDCIVSLFGQKSGHFCNPPVIFNSGFGRKPQI